MAPFQLAYTVVWPSPSTAAPAGGESGSADPRLERRAVAEVGSREVRLRAAACPSGCTPRSRVPSPSRRTRCRSAAAACRPCIRIRTCRRRGTGRRASRCARCWSSLSTSPREGPVAGTEVPPPVSWQQWSSNIVTVEPGSLEPHVVLPLEGGARAELEARALAAEGPLDPAGGDVDQVGGPRVAHRDEERAVAGQVDRVDVVGVPGEPVGRQRGLGLAQRDVVERVPAAQRACRS